MIDHHLAGSTRSLVLPSFRVLLGPTAADRNRRGLQAGQWFFHYPYRRSHSGLQFRAQSFLDLDVADAAVRMRRGVERMREALADARDSSRQALQESITELESLARATEQRSVSSVRRLDEAFARANYALAQRHYLSALRAREQMAQARVGEELRRSAEYLQRARQQFGLQLRDEEAAVIERTRTLGSNLSAGLSTTSDEVAREFRNLSQSLSSLRDRMSVRATANDEPIRR